MSTAVLERGPEIAAQQSAFDAANVELDTWSEWAADRAAVSQNTLPDEWDASLREGLGAIEAYATQGASPEYVDAARQALAEAVKAFDAPGRALNEDLLGVSERPERAVRLAVAKAMLPAQRERLAQMVGAPAEKAWVPKGARLARMGKAVTAFFAKGKEQLGRVLEAGAPGGEAKGGYELRHTKRGAVAQLVGYAAVSDARGFGIGIAGSGRLM